MEFTTETTSIIATYDQYMKRFALLYSTEALLKNLLQFVEENACDKYSKSLEIPNNSQLDFVSLKRYIDIIFNRILTYIIHSSFAMTNFDIQLYTIILYIIRNQINV